MIRCQSHKQLPLSGFGIPFDTSLAENNRWIKLSQVIPWNDFAEAYYHRRSFCQGCPIGDSSRHHQAVNEGKSRQAKKLQRSEKDNPPADPPNRSPASDPESSKQAPPHKGKLILDATVAEQAIRFPTNLSLLNEARELTEKIINHLILSPVNQRNPAPTDK